MTAPLETLPPPETITAADAFAWSHSAPLAEVKRLIERGMADPAFQRRLLAHPAEAAAEYGYTWDASEIPLFFRNPPPAPLPTDPSTSLYAAYQAFQRKKLKWRDSMRRCTETQHARYGAWRERQKKRVTLALGPIRADSIVHAPMCFELNKGCSVGCWFCGISAPRLSDIWPGTPENRQTWRAVLTHMRDIVGGLARYGFCYWATDPLDNPDYEQFCVDYHEILGVFPQTTTALALRDPQRTRALLRLSESRDCVINRFSLITLKQFLQAHETFTADELLRVECIAQNNESMLVMANAGKASARSGKKSKEDRPLVGTQGGTIACVSGFLFNMVDRTVKLITPCEADTRWPLGYWVIDEAVFESPDDLTQKVRRMLDRLPASARDLPHIRFARTLTMKPHENGFTVKSAAAEIRVHDAQRAAWLQTLGQLIADGDHGVDDIATLCFYVHGVTPEATVAQIEDFFAHGMLDEEPPPPAPADAYLSLFDPPTPPLAPSPASQAYHARLKQPHDDVLWLSRLRPPDGPAWAALAAHGIAPRGVLHVGGHYGLELEGYIAAGFERIVFVEPSPLALGPLQAHVSHWNAWFDVLAARWGLVKRPHITIIERAASHHRAEVPMHLTELEMLSSLQRPIEGWMTLQRTVTVTCDTIDAMLAEHGLSPRDFTVLNIDVQGHEAHALDGASALLASIDAVLVELNFRPRYEGAATVEDVEARLIRAGLRRESVVRHGDGAVGDALFVRARD